MVRLDHDRYGEHQGLSDVVGFIQYTFGTDQGLFVSVLVGSELSRDVRGFRVIAHRSWYN